MSDSEDESDEPEIQLHISKDHILFLHHYPIALLYGHTRKQKDRIGIFVQAFLPWSTARPQSLVDRVDCVGFSLSPAASAYTLPGHPTAEEDRFDESDSRQLMHRLHGVQADQYWAKHGTKGDDTGLAVLMERSIALVLNSGTALAHTLGAETGEMEVRDCDVATYVEHSRPIPPTSTTQLACAPIQGRSACAWLLHPDPQADPAHAAFPGVLHGPQHRPFVRRCTIARDALVPHPARQPRAGEDECDDECEDECEDVDMPCVAQSPDECHLDAHFRTACSERRRLTFQFAVSPSATEGVLHSRAECFRAPPFHRFATRLAKAKQKWRQLATGATRLGKRAKRSETPPLAHDAERSEAFRRWWSSLKAPRAELVPLPMFIENVNQAEFFDTVLDEYVPFFQTMDQLRGACTPRATPLLRRAPFGSRVSAFPRVCDTQRSLMQAAEVTIRETGRLLRQTSEHLRPGLELAAQLKARSREARSPAPEREAADRSTHRKRLRRSGIQDTAALPKRATAEPTTSSDAKKARNQGSGDTKRRGGALRKEPSIEEATKRARASKQCLAQEVPPQGPATLGRGQGRGSGRGRGRGRGRDQGQPGREAAEDEPALVRKRPRFSNCGPKETQESERLPEEETHAPTPARARRVQTPSDAPAVSTRAERRSTRGKPPVPEPSPAPTHRVTRSRPGKDALVALSLSTGTSRRGRKTPKKGGQAAESVEVISLVSPDNSEAGETSTEGRGAKGDDRQPRVPDTSSADCATDFPAALPLMPRLRERSKPPSDAPSPSSSMPPPPKARAPSRARRSSTGVPTCDRMTSRSGRSRTARGRKR